MIFIHFQNRRLKKPDTLLGYIDSKVVEDGYPYYIALNEARFNCRIHTQSYSKLFAIL